MRLAASTGEHYIHFSASQRIPDGVLLHAPRTLCTCTPWKCARLRSCIARGRVPSLLLDCERRTERRVPSRLPAAAEYSYRGNIKFLHGLLDLPLTTCRELHFGRPASPLSVSIQRRDTALAPPASMSLRKTGSQTSMPQHHWTSSCRACLTLSVASNPPRTSSTKRSSTKQSSYGEGPAENAATSESSSLPRGSSRMTFRLHQLHSFLSWCQASFHLFQKHFHTISRARQP